MKHESHITPSWRLAADTHSKNKRERAKAALPVLRALLDTLKIKVLTIPRRAPYNLEAGRAVHQMKATRKAIYAALLTAYGKPVPERLRQTLGNVLRTARGR